MLLIDVPNFTPQKEDLAILFIALISFLAFIWASKQLINFLGLDDFGLRLEAKKQIKLEDRQTKIKEYKSEYRKIEAEKKELKLIKQEEKKSLKIRAENGRVINVQKRLDKENNIKSIDEKISTLENENKKLERTFASAAVSEASNKAYSQYSANTSKIIELYARRDLVIAQSKPLAERIPKTNTSNSTNGKRTQRKEFMSKKYRETFNVDINGNKI